MQVFLTQYIMRYLYILSQINYACIIWGQNIRTINRIYILQKKALRIINFKERNALLCFVTLKLLKL